MAALNPPRIAFLYYLFQLQEAQAVISSFSIFHVSHQLDIHTSNIAGQGVLAYLGNLYLILINRPRGD